MWLLGKLWQLLRRKNRLSRAIGTQRCNSVKALRFGGRKQRKE
ncbi:High mobility group protein Z (fragment) [Xenorhabdus bovienii str. feltiae Florida]